jgi:hypothetical protein
VTISFIRSVCLSTSNNSAPNEEFSLSFLLQKLSKSLNKIQDNILIDSVINMNFSNLVEKIETKLYVEKFVTVNIVVYETMWKNVVNLDKSM